MAGNNTRDPKQPPAQKVTCAKCGYSWKPRGKRKGAKEDQQRCPQCNTRNWRAL